MEERYNVPNPNSIITFNLQSELVALLVEIDEVMVLPGLASHNGAGVGAEECL